MSLNGINAIQVSVHTDNLHAHRETLSELFGNKPHKNKKESFDGAAVTFYLEIFSDRFDFFVPCEQRAGSESTLVQAK